jgi:hypothetical protein
MVSRVLVKLAVWDQVKWPWKVSMVFELVLVLVGVVVVDEDRVLELDGLLVYCWPPPPPPPLLS